MTSSDNVANTATTPEVQGPSQGGYYPINEFVRKMADTIHEYMAEAFHTKGIKSDYSSEELDGIEKAVAVQVGCGAGYKGPMVSFEYRGHGIIVCDEAVWGAPAAVIDGRCGHPVSFLDLREGEFLEAIDAHLDKHRANVIRYTETIWKAFDHLHLPDPSAEISRGRVASFRSKAAGNNAQAKERMDAADKAVAADFSKAIPRFLDCLFNIGYVGMAGKNETGDWLACVQAPKDPSLVMFVRLTPEGRFDCAAMYLDQVPEIFRDEETLKGSFFDTKGNTLTESGIFCAIKRWASARTRTPVSRMLAEFCCFDKEACRFLYGTYGVPRWREDLWHLNRSIWPNFECEAADPYFCWIGNVHHTLRVNPELLPYELETAENHLGEDCIGQGCQDVAESSKPYD